MLKLDETEKMAEFEASQDFLADKTSANPENPDDVAILNDADVTEYLMDDQEPGLLSQFKNSFIQDPYNKSFSRFDLGLK